MKKVILSAMSVLYSCILLGQNKASFYDLSYDSPVPPAPTSSVFRQFSGYTPSLATGAVNIPILLYELKINNFTLPFSLQYFTSGIKVMDPAFPVGYGWSFNPGLRITRTIRGRADGLSIFPMHIKSRAEVNDMGEDERFYYLRSLQKKSTDQSNPDYLTSADSQYDIFTIHLPSGNFTFIIKDNAAYTFGNMLKIKPISDGYMICGFQVIDEYGIKYYFGKDDQNGISDYTEISTDSNCEYTAWMLRKIKFPDDDLSEIDFTWEKTPNYAGGLSNQPYESSVPIFLKDSHEPDSNVVAFHERAMEQLELNINPNNKYGYALLLKQVNFSLGTIKLEYFQNTVMTSFKVQDALGEIIKQINFTYEKGPLATYTLLSSVKFLDEGTYRFTYNPERFIYFTGQDYWGYYNGRSQSSLIPKTKMDWGLDGQINFSGANRSIDRYKMQANMLIKIDYPTGGYTEFEYEPHCFEEPVPRHNTYFGRLTEGRGLRVSKVITKSDAESVPVIKTYLYGKNTGKGFNTNGLGVVRDNMSTLDSFSELNNYETLIQYQGIIPVYAIVSYRIMHINSISQFERTFSMTPPVYYNYITELISTGDNSSKLKTEYTFSQFQHDDAGFLTSESCHYFVSSETNLFSEGPVLTDKKIYKQNSNGSYLPVESFTYQYVQHSDDIIFGLYSFRNVINTFRSASYNEPDFPTPNAYYAPYFPLVQGRFGYSRYPPFYIYIETRINPEYNELTGETKTIYTDHGEITEKIKYAHENNTLLLKKETTGSDGVQITEEYQYRIYNNQTYAYPVLITRKKNALSESKQIQYYHNKIAQIENTKWYKDVSAHSDGLRVVYRNYNAYGKPAYITLDDATKTVYLWSYKGQYPVAEITNATYDQVKAVIPENVINSIADAPTPTTDQLNRIDNLRTQLTNAFVTTYTYRPLTGLLTVTDPRGLSVYYQYNAFNRLKYIRDHNKRPLSRYQYNYHDGSGWEEGEDFLPVRLKFNYYDEVYSLPWNTQFPKSFRAIKAGGSNSFQFIWVVKDSNNEVLVTHNSGTNPEYTIDLCRWGSGQMILECTVKDLITHETKTVSQKLNVYMTPLLFEDLKWQNSNSGTAVTANIISAGRKTVRFIHESQIDNVIYLFRDPHLGLRVFRFNSGTEYRDIIIEAGVTTVELYLENSVPEVFNQVKLKIFASDYPLTHIGNPYKWISDYLVYPNPYQ